MSKSILALDLASVTGWAYWQPSFVAPMWGTFSMPQTGNDVGRYLAAYKAHFEDLTYRTAPSHVVFEAPILSVGKTNIATARKLMCLAGFTEYLCRKYKMRCYEVHLQATKRHFAGNGRATKDEMVAAAKARGFEVKDDNEADALAALDYAVHMFKIDVPWACGSLFGGAHG